MWGEFFDRNLWTDTPVLTRLPGTQKSSVVLFAAFLYNVLSAVEESDVLGGIPYYQFDPYREMQLEAEQVPAIKAFSQSIVKWLEEHGTEENRVIQKYGLSFPKIRRFADELGHVCDVAMEHGCGLSGLGD